MKRKNGFTLIELLAVIVILAIIALIATPIVLNMINNARKKAAESSAYGFIDAIEYNNGFAQTEQAGYTEINGENLDATSINVKMKGKKPTSGTVTIVDGKVTNANICVEGYTVVYEKNDVTSTTKGCNNSTTPSEPAQIVFGEGTTFRPTYFGFDEVTTSSPTVLPEGKNVFIGLDTEGNRGFCINREGYTHCFGGTETAEQISQHILSVFSDIPVVNNLSDGTAGNRIFQRENIVWLVDAPDFNYNIATSIIKNGNDSCFINGQLCCDQGKKPSYEFNQDNYTIYCN